ncbi:hypothetical protein NE237_021616 [Protea cynaroides]|uniref:Pentatricopeptide repeat-containing protein n=1 Tax=Protea cynaroides TaxID=273540 RepID=A0A9Q0HAL0_9MAGN|nr:hypothetical protein NE237_021616 [Protea cynaroides]
MEPKNLKLCPHINCSLIHGFFELSKAGGFKPKIPTYNAVVVGYCNSMQMLDAYRVVDEMRQFGVGPDGRTHEIILHNLIKANRKKEAFSLYQRMGTEFGCEPSMNIYSVIVKIFCEVERINMALKV